MTLPLTVEISPCPASAEVGQMFSVSVLLTHADTATAPIRVERVELNTPLLRIVGTPLAAPVVLGPGEVYRLGLDLRVETHGEVDLSCLRCVTDSGESIPFPSHLLRCQPAFPAGLNLTLEPAEPGFRLRLTHDGQVPLNDLRLTLVPIITGQQVIRRAVFAPGDHLETHLVTDAEELKVRLLAHTAAGAVQQTRIMPLRSSMLTSAVVRETFRFLQPAALQSGEKIRIERESQNGPPETVPPDRDGRYWLLSGARYRLVIQPRQKINGLTVSEIPQTVFLRKDAHFDKDSSGWLCPLEVAGKHTLRQKTTLHYAVQGEGMQRHGQIPVGIYPSWTSKAILAASLGGALTLQGLMGLMTLFQRAAVSENSLSEVVNGFTPQGDFILLRLLSIPLCLPLISGAGWLYEWFQE